MIIRRIGVSGFRNLEEQTIEFSGKFDLLVGDNGQGKTNLIESVYILSALKSFRSGRTGDVIAFNSDNAQLKGLVMSGGTPVELQVVVGKGGRRFWVGGRKRTSLSDYLGILKAVAFTPDDLRMVKGEPSVRRRFLDRAICLFDPLHLETARDFNKALKSRNKLLKENVRPEGALLESFTRQIAKSGARLSMSRSRFVKILGEKTPPILASIENREKELGLLFTSDWSRDGDISEVALFEVLDSNKMEDFRRRTTTKGPQHDDFEILLGGESVRRFGSQGQQRSCAVALLLSIVESEIERKSEAPVLLLDDVSSELDPGRRKKLFDKITDYDCQVLVSTTEVSLVESLINRIHTTFTVKSGIVSRKNGE